MRQRKRRCRGSPCGRSREKEKVFKAEGARKPLSQQDLLDKYNRMADYWEIDKDQAKRILDAWSNLKSVKDIGDPIQLIAKFGKPRPLSDITRRRFLERSTSLSRLFWRLGRARQSVPGN